MIRNLKKYDGWIYVRIYLFLRFKCGFFCDHFFCGLSDNHVIQCFSTPALLTFGVRELFVMGLSCAPWDVRRSICVLHALEAGSMPCQPTQCDNRNYLQTSPNVFWGGKVTLVENHRCNFWRKNSFWPYLHQIFA